jgi:nucleoside-diphosphate-sugar epimerase
MIENKTILVTGATGFLGSHVCSALAASGANVHGFARARPQRAIPGVSKLITGELRDREQLRQALHGASAVVHLAGRAHLRSESSATARSELQQVNVGGTDSLIDEVRRSGVRRFIQVSSVAAVTGGGDQLVSETTPPRPVTEYGRSKLAADQIVSTRCQEAGIEYAILRPPMVYGPGMKGNPLRLFGLIDRGIPLPVASIRNQRTLLYVGNFVEAIRTLLFGEQFRGGCYLLGDEERVSTPDLIRIVANALDVRPRLVAVPEFLLRLGARLGDVVDGRAFLPTTQQVEQLIGSLIVDSSLLTRATGFRQRFSLNEGMKATADWYHAIAQ